MSTNGNEYLIGHLEEALVQTGETDVHVRVTPGQLVITGNVTTELRREAITAIANDLVTNLDVQNEVVVLSPHRRPDPENIA